MKSNETNLWCHSQSMWWLENDDKVDQERRSQTSKLNEGQRTCELVWVQIRGLSSWDCLIRFCLDEGKIVINEKETYMSLFSLFSLSLARLQDGRFFRSLGLENAMFFCDCNYFCFHSVLILSHLLFFLPSSSPSPSFYAVTRIRYRWVFDVVARACLCVFLSMLGDHLLT